MRKTALATLFILFVIASCTKKAAPTAATTTATTATTTTAALDGASIFSKNCARCHGPQGVKDSRTPNLQTIDIDKAHMVNSITNGKDKMPVFKKKLSPEQISAVADLLVSWHNKK